MPELHNLLWQQASLTERSLWSSWLEPFLEQLASRLERSPIPISNVAGSCVRDPGGPAVVLPAKAMHLL